MTRVAVLPPVGETQNYMHLLSTCPWIRITKEKLGWTIPSQTIANHNPSVLSSFALFLTGEGYIFRKKYETKENGVI